MNNLNENIITMSLEKFSDIAMTYYNAKIPLYLWGRPSTGKTSKIRQLAHRIADEKGLVYSEDTFGPEYFTLKVIPLSQYDAPDLRGMPKIMEGKDGSSEGTVYVPTFELPREGQGILFFDEMNLASDFVRAACYQIILEGRYSNLPPVIDADGNQTFWRIAASNSENDFCSVNDSSLALLRRFSHIQIDPTPKEIINWFIANGGDSRVLSYISAFSSDLFPIKWDESLLANKANPFPSSWWNVSRLISEIPNNAGDNNINLDNIGLLASSCLGTSIGMKFKAHCSRVFALDMDELIKTPKVVLDRIKGMDDRTSLLYSISFELNNLWGNKEIDNKIKKLGLLDSAETKMTEILTILPPEFATSLASALLLNKKRHADKLLSNTKFRDFTISIGRYLDY